MSRAYVERTYRGTARSSDLFGFTVQVKKTDMYVAIDAALESTAERYIRRTIELVERRTGELERYVLRDPMFLLSLVPHRVADDAPLVARLMAESAALAGVGPMAAVAGAFAEMVGRALLEESSQVIVENGGDVFILTTKDRKVAIFAGESELSNKLALLVRPADTPIGICTSSGTVGPSLSLGTADAAVAMARSAPLADAAATALGNLVRTGADIAGALDYARGIPGISGAVIIKGGSLGAWGKVELTEVCPAGPGTRGPGSGRDPGATQTHSTRRIAHLR